MSNSYNSGISYQSGGGGGGGGPGGGGGGGGGQVQGVQVQGYHGNNITGLHPIPGVSGGQGPSHSNIMGIQGGGGGGGGYPVPVTMIPGINDTPLEFNINKNMPLMRQDDDEDHEHDRRDRRRERDRERNRTIIGGSNKNNGHRNIRSRSLERSSGPSSMPSGAGVDHSQSLQLPLPIPEHSDNINHQQGMLFGGLNMGGMYPGGVLPNSMPMVGNMMMDPSSVMNMSQYAMMPPMDNQINEMAPPIPDANAMPPLVVPDVSLPPPVSVMANFRPPVKETVHFKSCTLIPPYPNSAPPTTRDRPPGCRTVFVGGLPENITEEIITEIFEKCGDITSLRLSKKNFCHIRFAYEQSVDRAIFISGYRIRINDKTDSANCGRLHVDFAQARDDQHEWECKQRALQREARHRERQQHVAQQLLQRNVSPPAIHHYTDHEAAAVCEKIKQDDNFSSAVQVVISWLERGDCNKKNVNVFYSMIQSTNSHVRRLLNEKTQYEEDLQSYKDEVKNKMQAILSQFGQVEKVFSAASHKKVWDHFTKAQRKNIDMWKKQSSEIRIIQLEDFLQETIGGEEMDVSDNDDDNPPSRKKTKFDGDHLKEENDSLKCQLEAYKNEVDILKLESSTEIESQKKQILELKSQLSKLEAQLSQAKREHTSDSVKLLAMEAKLNGKEDQSNRDNRHNFDPISKPNEHPSENEAKLIGIISTFLHVHPFGASTDYIWSYVQKIEKQIRPNQVEELLRRFPRVFTQEISGVGANMERKWIFKGFSE